MQSIIATMQPLCGLHLAGFFLRWKSREEVPMIKDQKINKRYASNIRAISAMISFDGRG